MFHWQKHARDLHPFLSMGARVLHQLSPIYLHAQSVEIYCGFKHIVAHCLDRGMNEWIKGWINGSIERSTDG